LTFFWRQDVVVSLVLESRRLERQPQLRAQELDAVSLVAVEAQAHPDQVKVIGHEAISWAKQPFARGRVEHHLAKDGVESRTEPTRLAMRQGHRPENDGIGLIELAF
jgi:hypothetical protein